MFTRGDIPLNPIKLPFSYDFTMVCQLLYNKSLMKGWPTVRPCHVLPRFAAACGSESAILDASVQRQEQLQGMPAAPPLMCRGNVGGGGYQGLGVGGWGWGLGLGNSLCFFSQKLEATEHRTSVWDWHDPVPAVFFQLHKISSTKCRRESLQESIKNHLFLGKLCVFGRTTTVVFSRESPQIHRLKI